MTKPPAVVIYILQQEVLFVTVYFSGWGLVLQNSMRLFLSHKISGVLTLHEAFGAYIALTGSDAEWAF